MEGDALGDREVLADREVRVPLAVAANGAPAKITRTRRGARRRDNGYRRKGGSVQEQQSILIIVELRFSA